MKNTIHTITICFILSIFALTTGACGKKEQEVKQAKPEIEQVKLEVEPAKEDVEQVKEEVIEQDAHKGMSSADLFDSKCTSCHEAKRAQDMHASEESFADIIKKMIKKGAKVNSDEEKEISEFLAAPSRFLMQEKCSKCHTLDRIYAAHEKGQLTKDTLKKMQQKEGSGITEKEVDSIYEGLNSYYFVSPQIPVAPGF